MAVDKVANFNYFASQVTLRLTLAKVEQQVNDYVCW
jgi:hypothetical protein